jgi:ABC-type phosphate/phosphonate transport system substrate-binding protein
MSKHRRATFWRIAAVGMLLVMLSFDCTASGSSNSVRTGYSIKCFFDNDIKDVKVAMDLWSKELAGHFDLSESVTIYDDIHALGRDFSANRIDAAVLTTPEYFAMEKQFQGPLAFARLQAGKKVERLVVLARVDKGYKDVSALSKKRLAYVKYDELAMIYLNSLLLKKNLPLADKFFASMQVKQKPINLINALYFDQADICVTTERAFKRAQEMNPQIGEKLKIMFVSPELVLGLAIFRKGYDETNRQKVISAMNRFEDYPRSRQMLTMLQMDGVAALNEEDLAETRRFFQEYFRLKQGKK